MRNPEEAAAAQEQARQHLQQEAARRQAEMAKMQAMHEQMQAQQRQAMQNAGQSHRIITSPIRVEKKVGRNDPCPCGSGKKYKQCCGKGLAE